MNDNKFKVKFNRFNAVSNDRFVTRYEIDVYDPKGYKYWSKQVHGDYRAMKTLEMIEQLLIFAGAQVEVLK